MVTPHNFLFSAVSKLLTDRHLQVIYVLFSRLRGVSAPGRALIKSYLFVRYSSPPLTPAVRPGTRNRGYPRRRQSLAIVVTRTCRALRFQVFSGAWSLSTPPPSAYGYLRFADYFPGVISHFPDPAAPVRREHGKCRTSIYSIPRYNRLRACVCVLNAYKVLARLPFVITVLPCRQLLGTLEVVVVAVLDAPLSPEYASDYRAFSGPAAKTSEDRAQSRSRNHPNARPGRGIFRSPFSGARAEKEKYNEQPQRTSCDGPTGISFKNSL